MKSRIWGRAAIAAAAMSAAVSLWAQAPPAKPAEEAFKNITELKGTPADQLIPAMQFISASLGVDCNFCHVQGKMDLDDKKPKKEAREMIAMNLAINKNSFEGRREVTCYTCHHGMVHPQGAPPVLETDAPPHPEAPPATTAAGPTADQILEKYVAAIGGEAAVNKAESRVAKGTLLMGGREMPVEVISKAPNKRISTMHMPNGDSITAFDGTSGWMANPGRPVAPMSAAESDAAALDAELHFATRVKEIFKQLRVGRPEKVGDAQCQVLMGMRPGLPPVRLYFDEQSGLLVRMVRFTETPLGRLPTQIDYSDYKPLDGLKVPLRWTIARPGGRFTIQIADVQQNVPVDDAKFAKPAAAN